MADSSEKKTGRKKRKVNKNYYLSPYNEDYLGKCAVRASVIAIVAALLWLPGLILFITPGIESLLWLREAYEAQVAYMILFFCAGIGGFVCAAMSFFGFRIRKKVKQTSAPTFGFGRASYNGIFITGVVCAALFLYQIVILVGYHVSLANGYIAVLIETYADLQGKVPTTDIVGIVLAVLYAVHAAAVWVYYVYTFRVNRTMQLVRPTDDDVKNDDTPVFPSEEEAEKHRPTFGLSQEEKELGKCEFADPEEKKEKKKNKKNK